MPICGLRDQGGAITRAAPAYGKRAIRPLPVAAGVAAGPPWRRPPVPAARLRSDRTGMAPSGFPAVMFCGPARGRALPLQCHPAGCNPGRVQPPAGPRACTTPAGSPACPPSHDGVAAVRQNGIPGVRLARRVANAPAPEGQRPIWNSGKTSAPFLASLRLGVRSEQEARMYCHSEAGARLGRASPSRCPRLIGTRGGRTRAPP